MREQRRLRKSEHGEWKKTVLKSHTVTVDLCDILLPPIMEFSLIGRDSMTRKVATLLHFLISKHDDETQSIINLNFARKKNCFPKRRKLNFHDFLAIFLLLFFHEGRRKWLN